MTSLPCTHSCFSGHAELSNDFLCCQEISFGANVVVRAHIRLSERDARLNRKLLRATLLQPGLTELTISEMLPQDLDAGLVRRTAPLLAKRQTTCFM